jgi:hypothetical protein
MFFKELSAFIALSAFMALLFYSGRFIFPAERLSVPA